MRVVLEMRNAGRLTNIVRPSGFVVIKFVLISNVQ